jgi:GrpB-like predicted nucleotidyltransferase (UPF0157 family)
MGGLPWRVFSGMDKHKPISLYRFFWFWKLQFWVEKSLLMLNLGKSVLGIEHVGSTSIRGMPAKPIVDISIAIEDYERVFWMVQVLERFGYTYLGENSDLREYAFERTGVFASKLFICEPDGEKWQTRIRFRDYVRRHPKEMQAYAALKEKLAQQYKDDLLAYQRAKLPFVQEILTRI